MARSKTTRRRSATSRNVQTGGSVLNQGTRYAAIGQLYAFCTLNNAPADVWQAFEALIDTQIGGGLTGTGVGASAGSGASAVLNNYQKILTVVQHNPGIQSSAIVGMSKTRAQQTGNDQLTISRMTPQQVTAAVNQLHSQGFLAGDASTGWTFTGKTFDPNVLQMPRRGRPSAAQKRIAA